MPKYILSVINPTFLKQRTIPSWDITDPKQKYTLRPGEYPVHSYRYDRDTNHYKVAFLSDSFHGRNTWWVHNDNDIVIKDIVRGGTLSPPPRGGSHNPLKVKWFSQLDNWFIPSQACNVTSVAMCLDYFGVRSANPNEQLEDELYNYCLVNGLDYHVPSHLAQLIRDYGRNDDFQDFANWDDVKAWIDKGNPAIVHGWFTPPGHIMVIIGYNNNGWIVNDPNGEWLGLVHQYGSYDTNASGERLTYSYERMTAACVESDNSLWIHYVSR